MIVAQGRMVACTQIVYLIASVDSEDNRILWHMFQGMMYHCQSMTGT